MTVFISRCDRDFLFNIDPEHAPGVPGELSLQISRRVPRGFDVDTDVDVDVDVTPVKPT
jgi:hypothetical protein